MAELSSERSNRPPRICLDARNIGLAQGTGIATFANGLIGANTELLVDASAGGGRARRYTRAFVARWRAVPTRREGERRIADDAFRIAQVHFDIWRRLLVLGGTGLPDLMHWTAPLPLRLAGVPNVYTILDTIPLDHATGTDPRRFHRILCAIAAVADGVMTLSAAARADIERWVPALSGRICVIPPAITLTSRLGAPGPGGADRAVLDRIGVGPGAYYLFAGTIEPRKNISALVEAFLASSATGCLVLAGPDGWRSREELRGATDRIRRVGYLPREALIALMQGAKALLFPSLAEGFGLPIIEAMALGTPVLTSRGGATEEVAGGAALLVDPRDPAALRAGIELLENDAGIRAELQARGLVRATGFTAERQAEALDGLYRKVIEARKQALLF